MKLPLINDFERSFPDPVWIEAAASICRRHEVSFRCLQRAEHGENIVVLIDDALVLKIYRPDRNGFIREQTALQFAADNTLLPVPMIAAAGEIEGFEYLIIDQLPGRLMTRAEWLALDSSAQVGLLTQLASGLKELHSHNAEDVKFDWNKFFTHQTETVLERQRAAGGNPEWLESLPRFLEDNLPLLSRSDANVFLHGDVHFGNLRFIESNGRPRISGMFDFSDSLRGPHEYEFVAPGVLMIQGQGELQREFFQAYGYPDADIDEVLRRRLMLLTILYECSSLKKYALRLRPEAVEYSLRELERAIWNFL